MKKILFVSVHPDDETLGCGGTILKQKNNCNETFWLILTAPFLNQPYGYTQEMINIRMNLISSIAKAYNFDSVYQLGFPTQLLHQVDYWEIIKGIESVISEVKPNILYVPFNNDVHSDHRIAFEAIYSCTKSFRKPFIETIYMFETLSETEFAPALQSTCFIPNVYMDITQYIKKKLEIMQLYEVEMTPYPFPRCLSSIESLARTRGSRAGVEFAEAFMLLYQKL